MALVITRSKKVSLRSCANAITAFKHKKGTAAGRGSFYYRQFDQRCKVE
jgi:hypothetical protein